MRIIFPTHDYNEASNENYPLHFILPKLEEVQYNYHLRSEASYCLRPICKTKPTQDFITFKY